MKHSSRVCITVPGCSRLTSCFFVCGNGTFKIKQLVTLESNEIWT